MFSQAQVNNLLHQAQPASLAASCIMLVGARHPHWGQVGTGILFQIAEAKFLITAAHLVKSAYSEGITLGASSDGGAFIVLRGNWQIADPKSFQHFDDPIDIAIYPLNSVEADRFTQYSFLRMSDIGHDESGGIYTVFGYPGVLNREMSSSGESLTARALSYTLPHKTEPFPKLATFNPRYSFLLDANGVGSTGLNGNPTVLSSWSNRATDTIRDLQGVSGGPVWLIAKSGTSPATWHRDFPRLVGIQVAIFPESNLLVVSRWACVIEMIERAFPDLSAAINLSQ